MASHFSILYQIRGVLGMFAIDIELGEPQYPILCKFSFKSSIYDTNLPEMIRNRLISANVRPNPNKFYLIDISFSVTSYKQKAFYEFPIERRLKRIGQRKQSAQESAETHINEVLTWQLKNICRELSNAGIRYRYATMAGEDFKDARRVVFRIYEDANTTEEVAAQTDRRKIYNPIVYTILSHRSSIIKKLVKQVANSFNVYQTSDFD